MAQLNPPNPTNIFRPKCLLSTQLIPLNPCSITRGCVQVEIALDFARGLAYLHSRRQPIVHRDLKPANLMISGNLNADAEQLYLDSGVIKVRTEEGRFTVSEPVKR